MAGEIAVEIMFLERHAKRAVAFVSIYECPCGVTRLRGLNVLAPGPLGGCHHAGLAAMK